jgi:hypothetical protein
MHGGRFDGRWLAELQSDRYLDARAVGRKQPIDLVGVKGFTMEL